MLTFASSACQLTAWASRSRAISACIWRTIVCSSLMSVGSSASAPTTLASEGGSRSVVCEPLSPEQCLATEEMSQEKCVMPTHSRPCGPTPFSFRPQKIVSQFRLRAFGRTSAMFTTRDAAGRFMKVAGCVAATSWGRSWPKARTVSAPGRPVSMKTRSARDVRASRSAKRGMQKQARGATHRASPAARARRLHSRCRRPCRSS